MLLEEVVHYSPCALRYVGIQVRCSLKNTSFADPSRSLHLARDRLVNSMIG